MDDVAKEAHVSKRTIYVYFNSKEQIYFEIMIRGYRELMAMFDKEEKAIVELNSIDKLRHMAMIFFFFHSAKNFLIILPLFFHMRTERAISKKASRIVREKNAMHLARRCSAG
ncbi:helix-turn-helix domain-containing protein [Terrilactibacillus sp. S3-3]|nr:helix-turn-helix domain-containing protein [Terrilactibacillus sp. S3-3]